MSEFYSVHRIIDGKWEVTLWIREDADFTFNPCEPPDLRALIDVNYEKDPIEMAKQILNSVLHCQKVQVNTLQGTGVYVER